MAGQGTAAPDVRDGGRASLLVPAALLSVLALLWWVSTGRSLTGDEALTIALARSPFTTMLGNVTGDAHVPGYYAVLWAWLRLFGDSLVSLRAPGLLAAMLTAAITARRRGVMALALMCASPFLLHLAVEIRMYSFLALAGACSLAFLQSYSRAPSAKRAASLALVLAAGTWIHHFAWPGTAASVFVMLWRRKPLHALLTLAIVLTLYIPQMPNLLFEARGAVGAAGATGGEALVERASPASALIHMPLSLAGTLLRFTSGTAPYRFTDTGPVSMSPWALAGLLLSASLCLAALAGFLRAGPEARLIIMFVMLPLAFLRPGARHFAFAFPAVMTCALAGLDRLAPRARRAALAIAALLSLALCIPFVTRSTMPQRCTFDRDFGEAARLAGSEAEACPSAGVVLYLDSYSTLAVEYHLDHEGFGGLRIWTPHDERFSEGRFFSSDPAEGYSFLMQDTDSLVRFWRDSLGRPLLILANDPSRARGRLVGGEDGIIGSGSDVMSDADLRDALERYFRLREIPLDSSEGPMTLFSAVPSSP